MPIWSRIAAVVVHRVMKRLEEHGNGTHEDCGNGAVANNSLEAGTLGSSVRCISGSSADTSSRGCGRGSSSGSGGSSLRVGRRVGEYALDQVDYSVSDGDVGADDSCSCSITGHDV